MKCTNWLFILFSAFHPASLKKIEKLWMQFPLTLASIEPAHMFFLERFPARLEEGF